MEACGKTLLTVVTVFFRVLGHFVWEQLYYKTLLVPVSVRIIVSSSNKFESACFISAPYLTHRFQYIGCELY